MNPSRRAALTDGLFRSLAAEYSRKQGKGRKEGSEIAIPSQEGRIGSGTLTLPLHPAKTPTALEGELERVVEHEEGCLGHDVRSLELGEAGGEGTTRVRPGRRRSANG